MMMQYYNHNFRLINTGVPAAVPNQAYMAAAYGNPMFAHMQS